MRRPQRAPSRKAWLFIFVLAMLLPWMLFDIVTGLATAYAVSPAALFDLGWPVAAGLLIGWGLAAAGLMAPRPSAATGGLMLWESWTMASTLGGARQAAGRVRDRFAPVDHVLRAAHPRHARASSCLLGLS